MAIHHEFFDHGVLTMVSMVPLAYQSCLCRHALFVLHLSLDMILVMGVFFFIGPSRCINMIFSWLFRWVLVMVNVASVVASVVPVFWWGKRNMALKPGMTWRCLVFLFHRCFRKGRSVFFGIHHGSCRSCREKNVICPHHSWCCCCNFKEQQQYQI